MSQSLSELSFEEALKLLKQGLLLQRKGWNGKGMWLCYINSGMYTVDPIVSDGLELLPWIGMKTADHGFVPWLASQTDVFARDWQVFRGTLV
jgi:hypothetical protein